MNFPNHQHPVEDLSNSGEIGREIVRSDTAAEVIDIILPTPLDVPHGGTGVATLSAGVVVADGTTPFTSITGTNNIIPKWDSNTLANSILSETASGKIIQEGDGLWGRPETAYNANPKYRIDFISQYNTSGSHVVTARVEGGKATATDGDTSGYYSISVHNGTTLPEYLRIASTGAVTLSNLTASKFVKTDGSKVLTSTDITPSDITSPGALTRVDDTNVTLTLGGTPSTALLQSTSLTLG